MKTVLLGASGFVGRNVEKILGNDAMEVVTSSRSAGLDLLDLTRTISYLEQERPDYIVNCAAHVGSLNYVTKMAADVTLDNMRMILNLYEACSKLEKKPVIINPIANCAYPATSASFVEEEWWNGHLHRSVLSYGATRRMLWSTGESFTLQHNIRSIYLLVPNMYGPYDSTDPNKAHALNALISKFVKAEKEGRDEIVIWGTGIAVREWLYAEDFGRIVSQIISENRFIGLGEPVNIAQNFGLSVRELVELINSYFGHRFKIQWDEMMPDGALRKVMDDQKFKKVFPTFKFTEFDKGIKATIDYYKSIYPF